MPKWNKFGTEIIGEEPMSFGIHAVFEDHYIEEVLKNGTMRARLTEEKIAQQTDPEFGPTNPLFNPSAPVASSSCSAQLADLPPSNMTRASPPQSTKLQQGPSMPYPDCNRHWSGKHVVRCVGCEILFYDGRGFTHCCRKCCRAHRERRAIEHTEKCISRRC